ncbi:hypothetical protein KR018_006533 [Drosophila ironensis]|nr:hypothetical protein KR018_006533 [Drosophila ironensis]
MHLTSTAVALLIACLALQAAPPAVAQFWRTAVSSLSEWESEALATRPSGVCYHEKEVKTINPDSRRRQFSVCCDGYINEGTSRNLKCRPICEEDCTHGVCLSPGHCECAPGYSRIQGRCLWQN